MKLYKKIDLFFNGQYLCSTNMAKTCKEAKEKYLTRLAKTVETQYLSMTLKKYYSDILKEPNKVKAFYDRKN